MLEICIDSIASAHAAAAGGADRVELCSNLPEGGTSPSAGLIRVVRSVFAGRLMVMIRPRGYDFLYSEPEMEAMLHDIQTARQLGADGVVIGCLTADAQVDVERCKRLITAAETMDVTFHRAFDMARDTGEALEAIIGLGIRRILSSGAQPDVPAGISQLAALVRQASGRTSLMPGGGVTEKNIGEIVRATGVSEIHLSARHRVRGGMKWLNPNCSMGSFSGEDEYSWRETSQQLVASAKQALTEAIRARNS